MLLYECPTCQADMTFARTYVCRCGCHNDRLYRHEHVAPERSRLLFAPAIDREYRAAGLEPPARPARCRRRPR